MRRATSALVAVLALAAAPPALGAECPKTSLADVEDEVMCTVCGTPLELATEAPQAERQRALIRRLVADCRSKDEVKAVLAAEFGDEVLAAPGGDGFDLAAYLVPALAMLVAGAGLAVAALRWRRSRPPATHDSAEEPRDSPTGARARAPEGSAGERLESDLGRYDL